jgi:hypothetical protein
MVGGSVRAVRAVRDTQVFLTETKFVADVSEHRDAPFGGRCSETIELAGSKPTINNPPHLSRHPTRIHDIERFWFEEC